MRNHHRAIVGFVTVAGLLVGATASSAEEKMFAPQLCVGIDGEIEVRVDAVEQIDGPGYRVVACPLVESDLPANSLEKVWVFVGNQDSKDQTPPECCVYSISAWNNAYDYVCAVADEAVGRQTLEIDLAGFVEVSGGFHVVTCDLGYGDTIHGIRTREL